MTQNEQIMLGKLEEPLLRKAREFREKCGIRLLDRKTLGSGNLCVKVKTIDQLNYVDLVTLEFSAEGVLQEYQCSCGNKEMCVHIVAALLECVDAPAVAQKIEPASASSTSEKLSDTNDPGDAEHFAKDNQHLPYQNETSWDGQIRGMECLMGHNLEDGEPVYWCPNDTEQVLHTNTGIIGTMGTGKTQFTKSIITQLYRSQKAGNNFDGSPLNFLIFDYKGDYNESKLDFVTEVDATIIRPYRLRYNPLALNSSPVFRPLLPVHTANLFKDTLARCFGLGVKQQHLLLECILEAYAQRGIMPEDPNSWKRVAPTFEQVYQIYVRRTENKAPDSLSAAMGKIHLFQIFETDSSTTAPLWQQIQGVVVLDLSGCESDLQNFVVAITLDQFYSQMLSQGSSATDGKYRQLRTLILVDEADHLMRGNYPSLLALLKEGREFGVGTILSTQSLAHFASGEDDYSHYILTWIVHYTNELTQRNVEYLFKLPTKSSEVSRVYEKLKGLSKHESVAQLPGRLPIVIRNVAFFELHSANQE